MSPNNTCVNEEFFMAHLPASSDQCLASIRWITRQSIAIQLELQKKSRENYFDLKNLYKEYSPEKISLIAQLISAFQLKQKYISTSSHVPPKYDKGLKRIKAKEKWIWLQNHQALMQEYRDVHHLSYRTISELVEFRFRICISHSYLAKFMSTLNSQGGYYVC